MNVYQTYIKPIVERERRNPSSSFDSVSRYVYSLALDGQQAREIISQLTFPFEHLYVVNISPQVDIISYARYVLFWEIIKILENEKNVQDQEHRKAI